MSIDKLEKELQEKQKKYKKNVLDTIKDTFDLGVSEISNTLGSLFEAPKKGKNQISNELERYEEEVILSRKPESEDD